MCYNLGNNIMPKYITHLVAIFDTGAYFEKKKKSL